MDKARLRASVFEVIRRQVPGTCFQGQVSWTVDQEGMYSARAEMLPEPCTRPWSLYWIVGPPGYPPVVLLLDNSNQQGEFFPLPQLGDDPSVAFPELIYQLVGDVLSLRTFDVNEDITDVDSTLEAIIRSTRQEQEGKLGPRFANTSLAALVTPATRIRERPLPVSSDSSISSSCGFLQRLEETDLGQCQEPFTDESYERFGLYRNAFVAMMVRKLALRTACFAGVLEVAVNRPGSIAKVYDFKDTKERECSSPKAQQVIMGHLRFVPFEPEEEENLSQVVEERETEPGHAVGIILDVQNNVIEYYEPNGSLVTWTQPVLEALADYFGPGWTIIDPESWCPVLGVQRVSGKAMCASFATLFMLARIACPDVPRTRMLKYLLSLDREEINELLHRLHCFSWNQVSASGLDEAYQLIQKPFYVKDQEQVEEWTDLVQSGLHEDILEEMRRYWASVH